MNTEDDFDEFVAELNKAMTTPAYAATPDEIEALATEEYHVRNGTRWEQATEEAKAEALQWASLTLIGPAVQNILRSAQAKALDEAAEDFIRELDITAPVHEFVDVETYTTDWLEARAEQIRSGRR